MKIKNIDFIKGILILLVIIGHVLRESVSEDIFRYIIYSFHMPVFIGISGYLLDSDKLQSLNVSSLVKKYLFRLIIPWVIAIVFYLILLNYHFIAGLPFRSIVGKVVRSFELPYYHLWFVSAFLGWIIVAFVLLKSKVALKVLLSLSFLISVFFFLAESKVIVFENPSLVRFIRIVIHTFRPNYFFFFILGMSIRKDFLKIDLKWIKGLVIVFAGVQLVLFFVPNLYVGLGANILLNVCLLYLLIVFAADERLPSNKILEWIGVNSLGIYLWHMVPILILVNACGVDDLPVFYSFAALSEVLFILMIYYLSRMRIVNRIFFGR